MLALAASCALLLLNLPLVLAIMDRVRDFTVGCELGERGERGEDVCESFSSVVDDDEAAIGIVSTPSVVLSGSESLPDRFGWLCSRN